MMCHSIARVKSTMGQADFYLEYPKLHELAATKNPVARALHDFLINLNPEPHRRVFLKPFMRTQTPEFCSVCHKVHQDVPIDHYRWVRGFNEYDNWQASGVSGQGARSFYYPPKPQQCADCHMPAERSKDRQCRWVRTLTSFSGGEHRLAYCQRRCRATEAHRRFPEARPHRGYLCAFPRSGSAEERRAQPIGHRHHVRRGGRSGNQNKPGNDGRGCSGHCSLEPGAASVTPRRYRARGCRGAHQNSRTLFPGGTVDAYDTWLELKGTDDKGQTIFWSGMVEDGGKGPVEKGAHFYRSLQIDAHGNPINKRNTWATRAVVYVHLIPPGAADTVHYRMFIPENTGDKITLHARLCYRKFSWWNTQFSFAGQARYSSSGRTSRRLRRPSVCVHEID